MNHTVASHDLPIMHFEEGRTGALSVTKLRGQKIQELCYF